jgi:hypothetical protein
MVNIIKGAREDKLTTIGKRMRRKEQVEEPL